VQKANRDPQNQFLQPIKDSDLQGARNSRVFLKANVTQASSQLNPDGNKIFQFPGQSSSNLNFGQANFAPRLLNSGPKFLAKSLWCQIINTQFAIF